MKLLQILLMLQIILLVVTNSAYLQLSLILKLVIAFVEELMIHFHKQLNGIIDKPERKHKNEKESILR